MKTTIALLLTTILITSCSNENTENPLNNLPPETQTGANTFGFIVNGQAFKPRDGMGNFGGSPPANAITFWGEPSGNQLYNEIEAGNFKDGRPASRIILHLHSLHQLGAGEYIWKETNFFKGVYGLMHNNVFSRIYDAPSNSFKWYGSYQNSGKVIITKYDFNNRIVSGTFSGKLRLQNGTEEIEITNGRFDLKWSTLNDAVFP
jgi:hypothetical protein